MAEVLRVVFQPPAFLDRSIPEGKLVQHRGCWALWWYYMMACQALVTERDQLTLEGEKDYIAPYERLFRVAAEIYGTDIEQMHHFWGFVDMQINHENVGRVLVEGKPRLQPLPEEFRFRSIAKMRMN